jgi:peptidyl-dipeptidase A
MLGRLRGDPEFLVAFLGLDEDGAGRLERSSRAVLRSSTLVFARWCLVMIRFEQALYGDPSRDLATLWWDLVERFQDLRRPQGTPHRTGPPRSTSASRPSTTTATCGES